MKNNFAIRCTTLSVVIVFTLLISSVFVYALSSSWGFTMGYDGCYLNGSKNNVYHSLAKGGVSISGTIRNTYSQPGATGPNQLTFVLMNKTSGNSFGKVTVTPVANGFKTFAGTFSSVGGGTSYYLVIYRANPDGRTLVGSGTLKNL